MRSMTYCGDNVVHASEKLSWYKGESLFQFLEHVAIDHEETTQEARFQVQYVIRPQTDELHDYRGYAGSILSGSLKVGQRVHVLPLDTTTTIERIEKNQAEVEEAAGGGWGPVVTTSLLGGKMLPKKVIGTVNASEFFINLASATTLLFLVKITDWEALAGLIIGGFLIAPYAAKATSKMSVKMILTVVGFLIIILSIRKIIPLFI